MLLIDLVFEENPNLSDALIVLATDSMVAKHWLDAGDAKPHDALDILSTIHQRLEERNCRLYTAYVNTKKNLADAPSRVGVAEYEKTKGNYEEERTSTLKILQFAVKEAQGTFLPARISGMEKGLEEKCVSAD